MRKYSTILLVAGLSAISLAASAASSASKSRGAVTVEFAPLANPPGITMQPLGMAQGYSLNKESAAGLPHDAVVFTNEKGMTLYTSDTDAPGKSMCVDECTKTWIPALAPANADTSVAGWSVVARADGAKQWAYHGKPLYTYVKDVDVGSVGGNSPAVSGRGPMVGPRGYIRGPLPKEIPLPKGWHEAKFYPSEQPLPTGFEIKEVEDVIGLTLVNDAGHTLYVFDGDVNKDRKLCGTACEAWQPLAAPRLSTASGDFGAVLREDGIKQWTYKGRGLYTFAGDLTPVDANGIGVNEHWQPAYILRYFVPAGVTVQENAKLGKVWATAQGQTIYKRQGYIYQSGSGHSVRRGDTVRPAVGRDIGTDPRCGDCLNTWHPFLAPANAQPSGYWDVAVRPDGQKQWVYQGYALWTYDGDKKPGDIKGNDTYDIHVSDDNKTLVDIGTRYDWATALYWIVAYP